MKCFFKVVLCFAILGGLTVACREEQDKIGWEPEVATPLAMFTIDLNEEIDMAEYSKSFFEVAGTQARQNDMLYTAITEGLADSVRRRLPRYLQANIDSFIYRFERQRDIPEFTATLLLLDLFDSFKKNSSITAINSFTYYILTGLPQNLQRIAKDSLYRYPLTVRQPLGMDMSTITDRAEFLRWMKLQLTVNTRLEARANMQVYLRDSLGYIYDSLFRVDNSGRHEGVMPFANNASGEYKQRVLREYMEAEAARKTMNVHTISVLIHSDSLCLDTSLVWLKDLHNRKIHASVGVMFKMNMDDKIKPQDEE